MSIGSTIKRLRREKSMTQEQLAAYLGITSRAVSQWECDRTAPDLSQIPSLCHLFDVSSDVLLGIDLEKSNESIRQYLNQARNLGNQGRGAERTALLREANRKFPRDYQIMQCLADSLVCEYSRNGMKDYGEVFDLCNRILAECTHSITRYEAIETLGAAYEYAGKRDELLRLAKEMPRIRFSYENFMTYRWRGDSDFQEFQQYLSFLICNTVDAIGLAAGQLHDDGSFVYVLDDRIRLWEMQVSLLELLFPNGDFQCYAQLGESACSFLCIAYLEKQDRETAWHWIEKGANFAICMDTYDYNAPHTSPVLRGYLSGGWIMEAEGGHSTSLLTWLTSNEKTRPFREDERYQALINRLKSPRGEIPPTRGDNGRI